MTSKKIRPQLWLISRNIKFLEPPAASSFLAAAGQALLGAGDAASANTGGVAAGLVVADARVTGSSIEEVIGKAEEVVDKIERALILAVQSRDQLSRSATCGYN